MWWSTWVGAPPRSPCSPSAGWWPRGRFAPAGDELDTALAAYVHKHHAGRPPKRIKTQVGSAFPTAGEDTAEVRGRDVITGMPKTVPITTSEVRAAIAEPLAAMVEAVTATLDACPPGLAADIMDRGLALAGGGALLRGLDERLQAETGMPVQVVDAPLAAIAHGAGACVDNVDWLEHVLTPESRR